MELDDGTKWMLVMAGVCLLVLPLMQTRHRVESSPLDSGYVAPPWHTITNVAYLDTRAINMPPEARVVTNTVTQTVYVPFPVYYGAWKLAVTKEAE